MSVRVEHPGPPVKRGPRFAVVPTTKLGWLAVGLAAVFFPLVFAAGVVPPVAALGVVCALAGGAAAAIAIVRDHERGLAVLAGLVPFFIAVAFLLAEVF
jgi:hypothetical protein